MQSQLEALNEMLSGQSVEGFEAEVALCRGLAWELDVQGSADLWREYRQALKSLREALSDVHNVGEDVKALLARLGDPRLGAAAVRDAADA